MRATVVPVFHRAKVYTAYEYLEYRFDAKTRLLVTICFLISRGLGAGLAISPNGVWIAASALCAIAPSALVLILARMLQGVGGALLTPGSLAMIESSFRKAFTVVTLGPEFHFDASSGFFELQKTNPFAPQLATVQNVMALPGAVAITVKGEMVAALGVGGAPGGDKDEICAHAGVDKIQDRLPH